jgi:Bax protein
MFSNQRKNVMSIYKTILPTLLVCIAFPVIAQSDVRTVETNTYTDVLKLFNEIGYTAEQWQSGIREVPRIELTHIPKRWQKQSPHIPVKDKKNVFFRLAGPGILLANEKVTAERKQLLDKIKNIKTKDDQWFLQLAKKYKVISKDARTYDNKDLAALKNRVDTIPPSLSLAQAAEESSWGTSRFAIQGNALFGQWDFSGKGMKPKNQRKELGNYGIARFDTPQQSIEAYILNLNTHRAYKKLRDKRASMRKSNIKPTGWELAKTLDKYSERGIHYIESLHSIMRYNKLMPADDAYLWSKGKIIVSPAP